LGDKVDIVMMMGCILSDGKTSARVQYNQFFIKAYAQVGFSNMMHCEHEIHYFGGNSLD